MAIRTLAGVTLAAFLTASMLGCGGVSSAHPEPLRYTPALSQGMARLDLARSDETLLLSQQASVFIGGRLLARLGAGDRHRVDVPAGNHVITVSHRTGAAHSVLQLSANAGRAYRVLISLDPRRFPSYDGPGRPLKFIRESLDAPNDERQPLFLIQSMGTPEPVPLRSSMRQHEAELEREVRHSGTTESVR